MDTVRALKVARPFLAGLAATGLLAGIIAKVAGRDAAAAAIWAAATLPVLLALLVEIVTSLRRGEIGLDIVAGLSMAAALTFGENLAAAIVALMYAGGQYLEIYAERTARREMTALLSRVPRTAIRHRDGQLEEVAVDIVSPGDRLLIRQGDVVPVDGTVAEGVGVLDQSALTGEPLPVKAKPGEPVLSGSTNAGEAFDMIADPACGREHLCRDRQAGRRCAAVAGADVASGRPLCDRLSGAHRRACRRRLVAQRRPDPGRRGAGGGNALSTDPGGSGCHHLRTFASRQVRHPDQRRQGHRNAGTRAHGGHRQDRNSHDRPGKNSLPRTRMQASPRTRSCALRPPSIRHRST